MTFPSFKKIKNLRVKFLIIVLPPVIASFLIFSLLFALFTYFDEKQHHISMLESISSVQSVILAKPLWEVNFETVEEQVEGILLNREVSGAKVIEFTTGKDIAAGFVPDEHSSARYLEVQRDIVFQAPNRDHRVGKLTLYSRKGQLTPPFARYFFLDVLLLLLLVSAIIASAVWANKLIMDRPLSRLLIAIRRADRDNIREPVDWSAEDELGTVIHAYNQLIETLNAAKHELGTSEAHYKTVFENTGTATVIIEEDTTISLANTTYEKLSGYSKKEIEGKKSWKEFVVKEDLEKMRKYHIQRREAGRNAPNEYEFRFIDRNGEIKHIYNRISIIPGTQKSIAALMDITFLKNAEEILRKEKEKFRVLVEKLPLGVALIGKDSKYQYVNPKFVEIFGYAIEDIPTDRKWFEKAYPDPKYREQVISAWLNDLKRQDMREPRPRIFSVSCRNGSEKIIHFRTVTMENGDRFTIYEDITETTRLEKQLKHAHKMEAVGTLAGGVAHDLNNILSGLVSYPDLLLLDITEDSPLRQPILRIRESGQKAAAIVQDMLTLARRGVAITDVLNLNDIISDFLETPECESLKSNHLDVVFEISLARDLLNILGSPVHLSKTIMNLISNAAEAIPGKGEIFILTENLYIDKPVKGYEDVQEGDYVRLRVSDSGVGISQNDLSRIFEPFYTKKEMGRSGTGLGMAVVWGTVKDHNGYIDVQSTPGIGTTCDLYFPVTRREPTEKKAAVSMDEYMGNAKILVVDDIEEQRQIAHQILTKLGYRVTTVASGEDAVAYMKENSADLIILDMVMDPGIDGLETYKRILKYHPGQRAIIASGFSETERVKKAQAMGAGACLKKPYFMENIGLAVRAELNR